MVGGETASSTATWEYGFIVLQWPGNGVVYATDCYYERKQPDNMPPALVKKPSKKPFPVIVEKEQLKPESIIATVRRTLPRQRYTGIGLRNFRRARD